MPAAQKLPEVEIYVNQFLEYLEVERGSSPLTIRNYRHYLNRLIYWMKKAQVPLKLSSINQENIRQYRLFLSRLPAGKASKNRTVSRKTQGYHAIALRSFLKWLTKRDHQVMSADKIDLPKTDEREIKYLTGEQIDRLLNAPSLSTLTGKRDRAILEVLFSTGLRVSELTSLDRNKVNLERKGVWGAWKRRKNASSFSVFPRSRLD